MTIQERFEQYVIPEPNSGCFLWEALWNAGGYGSFSIGSRRDGTAKMILAHRMARKLAERRTT
jgi:hypothetical protein